MIILIIVGFKVLPSRLLKVYFNLTFISFFEKQQILSGSIQEIISKINITYFENSSQAHYLGICVCFKFVDC